MLAFPGYLGQQIERKKCTFYRVGSALYATRVYTYVRVTPRDETMQGEISQWFEEDGYGYIRPELSKKHHYFFDASSVSGDVRAIFVGAEVHFEVITGDNGKPQAVNVILPAKPGAAVVLLQVLCFALVPLVLIGWILHESPVLIGTYVLMSVLTYWIYWLDKQRALADQSRISGWQLHLLALLGGWPGALCAQQVLRHKTRNMGFVFSFWFIVLIHTIVLIDLALPKHGF